MPNLFLILCCIFPLWVYFHSRRNTKQVAARLCAKKINEGEKIAMMKLMETLIGKQCDVHTIDAAYQGTVEKLEDDWIVLKDKYYDSLVFINPEYIIGVRECKEKPKKAKKTEAKEKKAE